MSKKARTQYGNVVLRLIKCLRSKAKVVLRLKMPNKIRLLRQNTKVRVRYLSNLLYRTTPNITNMGRFGVDFCQIGVRYIRGNTVLYFSPNMTESRCHFPGWQVD